MKPIFQESVKLDDGSTAVFTYPNLPTLPSAEPLVLKEFEYSVFLDFVKQGLWKNNKLLSELCSVSDDTIIEWKKRKEAIEARRIALADTLKAFKNRGDVEKRLKEQGMEFDNQTVNLNIVDQLKKDKSEFGI